MTDKSYGSSAIVRLDEEEKEIAVSVWGEDKKGYLARQGGNGEYCFGVHCRAIAEKWQYQLLAAFEAAEK